MKKQKKVSNIEHRYKWEELQQFETKNVEIKEGKSVFQRCNENNFIQKGGALYWRKPAICQRHDKS